MSQEPREERKIEELPVPEQELRPEEAEAVKGGTLPFIEQDNLYKSNQVTDSTSNQTQHFAFGDGSVRG